MAFLAPGPLTRTTAIAAGGRPDDSAKIVSRQLDIADRDGLIETWFLGKLVAPLLCLHLAQRVPTFQLADLGIQRNP